MLSLVDLALAGVAGFLVYGLSVFIHHRWKLRKFPSPLALPIIGNLWDPEALKIIIYLRKQVRLQGKMFSFWPGMTPYLVVADRNAVREILSDIETFVKGPDYTEKFSVVFGQGLVTSIGETHKQDRALLHKFFVKNSVDAQLPMICRETMRMMKETIEPHLGETVDMQHFFHILALRCFGQLSISLDYGAPENRSTAERLNDGVKYGSNIVGSSIVLNLPMTRLFPSIRKLHRIVKMVDDHMDDVIEARLSKVARNEAVPDDVLQTLLGANTPRDKLHEHLRTLLSAGHDTTAFFGCYMAYLLSQNMGVQDKVKEEVQRVLGTRSDLQPADLAELKYCRMVMQETLRLYSVIPFVNRISTKEHALRDSGVVIPKGTVVLLPLGIMNRDEEQWEDVNEFRPERFEEITSHSSAKHGYLPFGYGSRTCIGNTLALTEGAVMLALLMQRYRIHPIPGFKAELLAGISLVSKNGVMVRLESDPLPGF